MDILNDILSALSVGLDSLYPNIPVYSELVPSKLPPRCFLIGFAGETTIKQVLTDQYEVSGKLDIAYLPPQKEDELELKKEMNAVFTKLALNLSIIRFGDIMIRLSNHRRQNVDDVLHDICSFKTILDRIDETPIMRDISVDKEELK